RLRQTVALSPAACQARRRSPVGQVRCCTGRVRQTVALSPAASQARKSTPVGQVKCCTGRVRPTDALSPAACQARADPVRNWACGARTRPRIESPESFCEGRSDQSASRTAGGMSVNGPLAALLDVRSSVAIEGKADVANLWVHTPQFGVAVQKSASL